MIEKVLAYIDTLDTPENIVVWAIYDDGVTDNIIMLADGIESPRSDCVKLLTGFVVGKRVAQAKAYRTSLLIALSLDIANAVNNPVDTGGA